MGTSETDPPITYATPDPEHAEALLLQVAIAFQDYKSIAPEGWEPPDTITPDQSERLRSALADPDCFVLMALHGKDPVGHTVWVPAQEGNDLRRPRIPGLCHVRGLFVLEPWWGTGIARELHARGRDTMTARGWREARLFTPAGQTRARRFYEREGWRQRGEAFFEDRLGLDLVEYRLVLG